MPDAGRATGQFLAAIDYWIGRLEMYGLVERTRDPRAYAESVIADLRSGDERVAAEAALTVAEWEPWMDHGHTDIPSSWWATPLGGLVAAAQGSGEMDIPDAMAALGLSRARVYQLLDGGHLRRGRAGGITRRSVARRMRDRD